MRRIFAIGTLLSALCVLPASAILDTNSNGLSDLWERAYNGGELFPIDVYPYRPGDDPDSDGWTNEQEAAAGTNPFDPNLPDGFIRPQTVHIPESWTDINGDGIKEHSLEAIQVTWPQISGKLYTLMFSPDLADWLPVGEAFIGSESEKVYNFPLSQIEGQPPPPDKQFWRVKIEDVDSNADGLTDAEAHTLGIAPGFTDANANGIPDEWEVAHSGAFAVYPPCLAARVAQNQSSAQSIYLNNDTGNIVNYSVELSGNTGPAYSSRDSLTGNVGYTWEDISASGTLLAVVSNADDAVEAVDITGFTFPFYGQNFSQVFVSSNGLLTFGQGSGAYSNSVLPSTSSPGNLIAALWDDLNPYPTGHIYFKQELDRLIVQYQDVARYGGADTCTFQVVLFADGRIQIHYQKVPTTVDSCTVGIQNSSGTSAIEVVHNAPYLVNQMAIEIRPVSEFFTVTPLSGVVPAHSTATLSGLFQSLKLPPGVYYANLAVSHDGAGISPQPVTARLEVKNIPSTVALASPADGLVVMEGQPVNLNATATDTEGITRVEFYDGGTKLGEVADNPIGYFFNSNTLSVGNHLFIARVVDVYGAVTDSLPIHLTVLADTDRDGMPDAWEIANGLDPNDASGINGADGDPDGDGLTNFEEQYMGTDPKDYYNGDLPPLSIVGGGDQRGAPGLVLPVPLSVQVGYGYYGYHNAPVTFTVTSGGALLSTSSDSGASASASVMVRSTNSLIGAYGYAQYVAQVYVRLPNNPADVSVITATNISGTQTCSVITAAATSDPTLTPPTNFTAAGTSPTTAELTWTASDATQATTIQVSTNGGATWITLGAVAAGVSSATITGMTPNASVNFRVLTGNTSGAPPATGASLSVPTSGGGSGSGGGSATSPATPAQPLSQSVVIGEQSTFDGYKYGYSGFQDNSKRYLVETDYYYSSDTDEDDDGGSTTTVNTTDPKTGNITPSSNITENGGGDYGGDWVIDSDTHKTRSGTDSDGSGETSESSAELSNEYTSATFHTNVESWVPAFTGTLTEGNNYASIYDSDKDPDYYPEWTGEYSITKLQYQFKVNQDPNGVVQWAVVFTPDMPEDGSPKIKTYSEPTHGNTKVPSNPIVIDPTNDNLGLNPGHKNGTYSIQLIHLTQNNYPTTSDATDRGPTAQREITSGTGSNSIAYITGTPAMPELQVQIGNGSLSGMTVEWSLDARSDRNVRGSIDNVHIPQTDETSVVELPINQAWGLSNYYIAPCDFFGGICTVNYQIKDDAGNYLTNMQRLNFIIRGKNPMDANAKTHIQGVQGEYGFAWAIVQHESRTPSDRVYNQFATANGSSWGDQGQPFYSVIEGNGWGMSQLDNPLGIATSTEEVYGWKINVEKMLLELQQKKNWANNYVNALRGFYQPKGKWEEPPATYTPPSASTAVTSLEASYITLYNGASWLVEISGSNITYDGAYTSVSHGGTRYLSAWQFHPNNAAGSKWEFHKNVNDYLKQVIYNEADHHSQTTE